MLVPLPICTSVPGPLSVPVNRKLSLRFNDSVDVAESMITLPVVPPLPFLFAAANVGDGKVYGLEFDLSTPLSAIGLDNTGVSHFSGQCVRQAPR